MICSFQANGNPLRSVRAVLAGATGQVEGRQTRQGRGQANSARSRAGEPGKVSLDVHASASTTYPLSEYVGGALLGLKVLPKAG